MPKIPFWVFIIIAILYFTSVTVDTMDIDASQYAGMSRELLDSHNWLQLYDHGKEYLDKPPFLLWVSALSMKVFGVGNFGYKLPSILFALWALYATYRLGKSLYNDATGRLAALILATCQGMFLMTNDIRCDTILMSWVVTAIWLIREWDVQRKYSYLFAGFAAVGFGMMTKGPIALMVPVFCFASDWALKRKWKQFLNPAYIMGIVIIGLILLPMSIGLYQQFDLHPEKIVDGKSGVSGLRFFYWSQSFGRITGESPWKNGADISFLLLNMLWSFLPWIFILLPAIVLQVITVFKQRLKLQQHQEFVTTGGFLLAYLALGSSAYQLPHYIFVVFPLAAIITAQSIANYIETKQNAGLYRIMNPIITNIARLILLLVIVLVAWVFKASIPVIIAAILAISIWMYLSFAAKNKGKLYLIPATAMIVANIFLTNVVYKTLLSYQVGSQAGRYIHKNDINTNDFMHYKMRDPLNALNFYAQQMLAGTDTLPGLKGRKYILTMDEGLNDLKAGGAQFSILQEGKLFKVSELTPDFLNPATRNNATKNYYLLKINKEAQ